MNEPRIRTRTRRLWTVGTFIQRPDSKGDLKKTSYIQKKINSNFYNFV